MATPAEAQGSVGSCPSGYTNAFSDDFTSNPFAGSSWRRYLSSPTSYSSSWAGLWTPGLVRLTEQMPDLAAAMFADTQLPNGTWHATFRFKVWSSTPSTGADGFTFMFYKQESPYTTSSPQIGGSLGFLVAPSTAVPGYGIEWDNYPTTTYDPSSQNHVSLVRNTTLTSAAHLAYATHASPEDQQWHTARITRNAAARTLNVTVDGASVLSVTNFDPSTTHRGFGFSAATGSQANKHDLDDVALCLPQPPTAAFGHTMAATCTQPAVRVDASNSTVVNGPITAYRWTWGDGTTSTGVTAQHNYTSQGTYVVGLRVTDNLGTHAWLNRSITWNGPIPCPVPPTPPPTPVAQFTAAWSSCTFLLVVNGSASTVASGTITSYAWTWGDGTTGSGTTAAHAYPSPGVFLVRLTVTSNLGIQGTTSHSVVRPPPCGASGPTAQPYPTEGRFRPAGTNAPPVPAIIVRAAGCGQPASLDAGGSFDTDGLVVSWSWAMAGGQAATGRTFDVPADQGSTTIELTVQDDQGAAARKTFDWEPSTCGAATARTCAGGCPVAPPGPATSVTPAPIGQQPRAPVSADPFVEPAPTVATSTPTPDASGEATITQAGADEPATAAADPRREDAPATDSQNPMLPILVVAGSAFLLGGVCALFVIRRRRNQMLGTPSG